MHMVGHYHRAMNQQLNFMIMEAMFQDETPNRLRQDPPPIGGKGYKEWLGLYLEMRQKAAIFALGGFGPGHLGVAP